MSEQEVSRIHNFERFANAAFDARNAYIQTLGDIAFKYNQSWDVVALFLETNKQDAKELIDYAQKSDFHFGDQVTMDDHHHDNN